MDLAIHIFQSNPGRCCVLLNCRRGTFNIEVKSWLIYDFLFIYLYLKTNNLLKVIESEVTF